MTNRYGYAGPVSAHLLLAVNASSYVAVNAGAQLFADMDGASAYLFVCQGDCAVKQGAAPVASFANGSTFVKAGLPIVVDSSKGVKLSVIGVDAGPYHATLSKVAIFQ